MCFNSVLMLCLSLQSRHVLHYPEDLVYLLRPRSIGTILIRGLTLKPSWSSWVMPPGFVGNWSFVSSVFLLFVIYASYPVPRKNFVNPSCPKSLSRYLCRLLLPHLHLQSVISCLVWFPPLIWKVRERQRFPKRFPPSFCPRRSQIPTHWVILSQALIGVHSWHHPSLVPPLRLPSFLQNANIFRVCLIIFPLFFLFPILFLRLIHSGNEETSFQYTPDQIDR
jgi:hypothetical protein